MEFTEIFNREYLKLIINNWEGLTFTDDRKDRINNTDWDPLSILKKYYKNSKQFKDNINIIDVNYTQKSNGRFYADNCLSLQNIPREVRHTIAGELYYDIDVENCHPSLLCQYLEKNNFSCKYLKYYVENKNKIFDELKAESNKDKNYYKIGFLTIINGGEPYIKSKLPFYKDFVDEMKKIHDYILRTIQETHDGPEKSKKKNKDNIVGTILSKLLCTIENDILQCMINYLEENKIIKNNLVMVFDGFMIRKSDIKSEESLQSILKQLEEEVLKITNYQVSLVSKEMKDRFDLSQIQDKPLEHYLNQEIPNKTHYSTILNNFNKKVIHVQNAAFLVWDQYEKTFIPKDIKQLAHYFKHLVYIAKDKDGNDTMKSFIDRYMLYEDDRNYVNRSEFLPPPLKVPENIAVHNLFNGFVIENQGLKANKNVSIKPWLDHVSILCNHDKSVIKYLINYLAHIIQKPGELNNIALCIKSEEGAGKNIFFNHFAKNIIGEMYKYETADPENRLFGRFSYNLLNKLLIIINEANSAATYKNADKLKDLITTKSITIEYKGINSFDVNNFGRIIFTTNNENILCINPDDRRFVLIQSSSEKVGDEKYFDSLAKYFSEPINNYMIYDYLKNLDISNVNWMQDRPKTEFYDDNIRNNLPSFSYYLKHLYYESKDKNKILKMKPSSLFEEFNIYCTENKFKTDMSIKSFGAMLKTKYAFIEKKLINGIIYIIDFKSVRAYLEKVKLLEIEEKEARNYFNENWEPTVQRTINLDYIED